MGLTINHELSHNKGRPLLCAHPIELHQILMLKLSIQ